MLITISHKRCGKFRPELSQKIMILSISLCVVSFFRQKRDFVQVGKSQPCNADGSNRYL